MDVESPSLLTYFEVSEELFPWPEERVQEIEQRRAALGDTLLYDILLNLGGIRDTDSFYPPNDVQGLERLLDAIAASSYDALKKDCLVYFLLLWHGDGREKKFQIDRSIPPQFAKLAEAYWCLDAGMKIPYAVSLLSDARLNTDYASKILQAIITAPDIDPHPLVVRYVRTAKPLLTEPDDLDMYLVALAHSSLFEAWQFQRSFNESGSTRTRLFKKMLEWCVAPNPRPTPLEHLLTIPLTPFEQSILHSYASFSPPQKRSESPSSPSPLGLATLQSLACTRLIQTGQYADAIKLHRKFSSAAGPKSSSTSATKMIQERNEMIQSLYSALPSVERTLLDAEIKGTPMFNMTTTNAGDTSMSNSQSWEDISAQELSTSTQLNGVGTSSSHTSLDTTAPASSSSASKPSLPAASSTSSVAAIKVPSSFSLTGSAGPGGLSGSALGLSASRSGASKFGGAPPIIPVSASNTSIPLLSASASSGFGGIPALSGSSSTIVGQTKAQPRKSLPFGSAFPLSSSVFGSSTSGARAGTSAVPAFSSSGRQANAFYKPPVINDPASNPFSVEEPESRRASQSPKRSHPQKRNSAEQQETEPAQIDGGMDVDDDGAGGLNFSLFGRNGESAVRPSEGRKSIGSGVPDTSISVAPVDSVVRSSTSGKRPPGAFTDEDEDDEMMEDVSAPPQPPPRQTRSRKSTAPTTSAASSSSISRTMKPAAKKPRQTKSALKRSVPGGMFDDEEDDSDGHSESGQIQDEDEDQVAPLANTRRTTRKTRSSVAATLSEESGPRRRSSRISTAGDTGASAATIKKSTRKSTAGTTGKRKQR